MYVSDAACPNPTCGPPASWRMRVASELSELVFSRRHFAKFLEIVNNLLLLLIISVTHSTCGVLCTVVGGVCAAASTILAVAIAKFRS